MSQTPSTTGWPDTQRRFVANARGGPRFSVIYPLFRKLICLSVLYQRFVSINHLWPPIYMYNKGPLAPLATTTTDGPPQWLHISWVPVRAHDRTRIDSLSWWFVCSIQVICLLIVCLLILEKGWNNLGENLWSVCLFRYASWGFLHDSSRFWIVKELRHTRTHPFIQQARNWPRGHQGKWIDGISIAWLERQLI